MSGRAQELPPAAETRRFGRAAGLLSIGVGFAGLLTYVYFAVASHGLSEVDYGEIVVLWSAVYITVATIFRPVEQLLSRGIAEHHAHGFPIGKPLRVAAKIQVAVAVAFTLLALALRGPLQDDLLSGDQTLYWILVVAVAAFGVTLFARGFLAGSRQFGLYAGLLIAEACVRLVFAVALAVGIAHGQDVVALGIAAAPILSLLIIVPLLGLRGGTPPEPDSANQPSTQAPRAAYQDFTLAYGGGFAAAVMAMMISEQVFLNAGPLIVRGVEGVAAAGFIFNVFMLARAPVLLFQATATSLLPHLTRLRSGGRAAGIEAFRLSVRVTVGAIAAFTALTGGIVLLAGPELMELAFGGSFTYDRAGLLIVTVGMGLYLSASTFNQAVMAQGRVGSAAACYLGSALFFVAVAVSPALDAIRRVEVGFAAGAALLCGLLFLVYRGSHAYGTHDVREAGSTPRVQLTTLDGVE